MRSTSHIFSLSSGGQATTGGTLDSPTATVTLEGIYKRRPKISLTPIGEDLADVNVWVNSITHLGNGIWQAEFESSLPSILVNYNVVGDFRI